MQEPGRILIRATNWVGDAVMSLPAIRAIKSRFPSARIAVVARPWVADLYAHESAVDRVIEYPFAAGAHELARKIRYAWALRRERFDLAILFQNAFEAALLAKVAGIPKIIGYDRDGRRILLTDPVRVPEKGDIPQHERFYYLELLRRAGLIDELPDVSGIRLEGASLCAEAGRARFHELGIPLPAIGVSPGAAYGSAKRWLPERFAESVARIARDSGATVCLFGSPAERALCDAVVELIGRHSPQLYARNLAGATSLRAFMEMAAACMLFVTNDSGAMHIASALGVPTVAVFGATNHVTTGPTGPLARVVRRDVSCSPCLLRECPIDHRCMTEVSASDVVAAAGDLVRLHALP